MKTLKIISFVFSYFILLAKIVQSSESASTNVSNENVASQNETLVREEIQREIEKVTHISKNRKLREQISNLILNSSEYNFKNLPEGLNGTGPVVVTVTAYIQNIDDIDDTKMDYTIRFIYRQSWIDNRFIYGEKQMANKTKYIQLNDDEAEKIWTPDLYFSNEKTGSLHTLIRPNTYTRIYPHGLVLQSFKLSLQLKCRMGLTTFPFDKQHCPVRITTYGYVKDEVEVQWEKNHPVDMRPRDLKMPFFRLGPYDTNTPCTSVTATGEYSCIILTFMFIRKCSLYIILLYLPSTLIVFVSWASFWINPQFRDARFAIAVGTILGLVTQTYVATKDSPPTSYVKASDLWIGVCQLTVFSAFLEYCFVNYLFRRQESGKHGYDFFEKFVELSLKVAEAFVKVLAIIFEFIISIPKGLWNFLSCCKSEGDKAKRVEHESQKRELLEDVKTIPAEKNDKESMDNSDAKSIQKPESDMAMTEEKSTQMPPEKTTSRAAELARRIDRVSRRLYPIMFGLFVLVYVPFFIIKANSNSLS